MVGMTIEKRGLGVSPVKGEASSIRKNVGMQTFESGVPLTKTIRDLGVGDTARFPIERHGSVKAIVSRLRMELIRTGWDAKVSVDYDNFQVAVRRVL